MMDLHLDLHRPWGTNTQVETISGREKVIVMGFHLQEADFISLQSSNWLTDQILDCFLALCVKKYSDPEASIARMGCCDLSSISKGLHNIIQRVEQKFMLFNDLWLVPTLIKGNHWILFVVIVKTKKIIILNSMYEGKELSSSLLLHLQILRLLILKSHIQCFGGPPDWKLWSIHSPPDTYLQTNGSDCGLYVCLWSYMICTRKVLPDGLGNMSINIRSWISKELLTQAHPTLNKMMVDLDDADDVEVLEQMNPAPSTTKPWSDLPKPTIDHDLIDNSPTALYLPTIITALWKATSTKCGAPEGCRVKDKDMFLCEACREFHHMLCVGDTRKKPADEEPYVCPMHPYIK